MTQLSSAVFPRRSDPEALLLARCQQANGEERQAVFALLHERLRERVNAACLRVLGDANDAQDACQETFCALFRKLDGFRFESRVSSWAYRVALHTSIDMRRRQQRARVTSLDVLRERRSPDGIRFDLPDDDRDRPLAVAGRREERLALRGLMAGLSPKLRDILQLRYLRGMSNSQIGARLAIPAGTVKSRLARAHRALELALTVPVRRADGLRRSA